MGLVEQVCVLDPSLQMLRETQRKDICATQGNAEHLPYPSACFDRIIVVDAFHHLGRHSLAVDELVRVLATGGRLVIEEPDIAHWTVKLIALGEKVLLMLKKSLKMILVKILKLPLLVQLAKIKCILLVYPMIMVVKLEDLVLVL